ncbi:hypothetical protein DYB36_004978 [Aphanomyces astaci]|uniref:WW domain-containing protein n=1 Tax=Aphanomyces astaci TaxID=112090 RepID=A0A397AWX6_APHAT|nr:hypothetical protein DYB36_004978 [Aphanomyces astaci]
MADWDAYVDDRGYTYYYNRITGDTAWEIPPHAAADVVDQPPATTPESVASSEPTDGTQVGDTWSATSEGGEWAFGGVNPADGTFYFIHTTTGERVTNLPMDTPQSATSNANKHDYVGPILLDKVAPEVQRCMDDLVQTIETQLAVWMRRRQRNAKALAKQHKGHRGRQTNKQAVVQQLPQQHHHPTPVRMTQLLVNAKRYEYSAEYAARRAELDAQLREDEVQKEVVRVTDRLALRRQRQVKQAAAWRRADIKEEQIQLRHHFTRVLVAKATNGLDIHGTSSHVSAPVIVVVECRLKRILNTLFVGKIDLSSGDDSNNNHGEPATKLKRDELFESEERAALVRHRTRQLERLFVAMDTDKRGTVSALHVLHHLVTHPTDAQRWVQPPRRGLDDLVTTGVLQAFFLQLRRVNLRQFATFVDISEDVVAQVDRIQAAMERAGLGVVSADVATWQSSMSNVKTGEAANRKQLVVNRLQQSFCTAKETCLAQVRHVLHFRELRSSGATTGPTGDDQQPIWQLAHKHVYLQLQPSLPSYCVHCRRCRARLGKLDRYDVEGTHR